MEALLEFRGAFLAPDHCFLTGCVGPAFPELDKALSAVFILHAALSPQNTGSALFVAHAFFHPNYFHSASLVLHAVVHSFLFQGLLLG